MNIRNLLLKYTMHDGMVCELKFSNMGNGIKEDSTQLQMTNNHIQRQ